MYIERTLEEEIHRFLDRKEVIAIVGPRQAGKTTFLMDLVGKLKKKKVKFITFENRNELELFNSNIETFREIHKNFDVLVIDEFQYAKGGGKSLKYLYDTTDLKLIISGSSSLEITFETGKYMVGRMFSFTLLPLSFSEFLSYRDPEIWKIFKNLKTGIDNVDAKNVEKHLLGLDKRIELLLSEYLIWGGYPAVVTTTDPIEKEKILESILENYLLKDIQSLLQIQDSEGLRKTALMLAHQIGSLIEYNEICNSANLSFETIRKYLHLLEETYILKLVKPFFRNKRTEIVKSPKNYFFDSGFRNYLISNFSDLNLRNDSGELAENFVFGNLVRKFKPYNINFWRTKSKAEVDFIITREKEIIPVEVKFSNNPTPGKSLYSFIDKFNPKKAFVLTKNTFLNKKLDNGTELIYIPAYCWEI